MTSIQVRRAIDGDDRSLDWVVERLSPLLEAQVRYNLGDRLREVYDPMDIVNTVWLRTLPQLPSLRIRDKSSAGTLIRYLSKAIRNEVANLIRKLARGKAVALRPNEQSSQSGKDVLDNFAADGTSIVSRVATSEAARAIRECIERLEERDRAIVILRAIEGCQNKEIAALLDMNENAIAQRYRRACARLRSWNPDSVFDEFDP